MAKLSVHNKTLRERGHFFDDINESILREFK